MIKDQSTHIIIMHPCMINFSLSSRLIPCISGQILCFNLYNIILCMAIPLMDHLSLVLQIQTVARKTLLQVINYY